MTEKLKRTYKQLMEVDFAIGNIYARDKSLKDSKFGYAYNRFYQMNVMPLKKEYDYERTTIYVKNALQDPTTREILIDRADPRGYKFSRDGLLKVLKDEKELAERWEKKEGVEVEPFLVEETPIGFTEEECDILKGLIIK